MVFSWFDISYLSSNEKRTKRGKLKVKDGPKVLKVKNLKQSLLGFKAGSCTHGFLLVQEELLQCQWQL